MFINRATFQANEVQSDETSVEGTVEVTIRNETRRVPARFAPKYNWIFAYGTVGRYQTGGKVWPASIQSSILEDGSEREHVNFGRYDNNPKFRKENCIWFA